MPMKINSDRHRGSYIVVKIGNDVRAIYCRQTPGLPESTIKSLNKVDLGRLKNPNSAVINYIDSKGNIFWDENIPSIFSINIYTLYDWEKTSNPDPMVMLNDMRDILNIVDNIYILTLGGVWIHIDGECQEFNNFSTNRYDYKLQTEVFYMYDGRNLPAGSVVKDFNTNPDASFVKNTLEYHRAQEDVLENKTKEIGLQYNKCSQSGARMQADILAKNYQKLLKGKDYISEVTYQFSKFMLFHQMGNSLKGLNYNNERLERAEEFIEEQLDN